MLIDTHCHLNIMVKKNFDVPLETAQITDTQHIIKEAHSHDVTHIINVGTSLVESINSIALARAYNTIHATVGIHPNDCTDSWKNDFAQITSLVKNNHDNYIVGIGECGIDRHYPDHNLERQRDAFRAHIELALTHNLALVVHSRDAYDETLYILEEYKNDLPRGIIHCFSYDLAFAHLVISWGYVLGIGGPITYPKNSQLHSVVSSVDLNSIVLETDAPFLPPQQIRGKQNHPLHIKTVAEYISRLRNESYENIATITTQKALSIFRLPHHNT